MTQGDAEGTGGPPNPEQLAGLSKPERLRRALQEYSSRYSRQSRPEGGWVDGIWQPSPSERRECCAKIRPKLVGNKQALEAHCRTIEHVAQLYGLLYWDLRTANRVTRKARFSLIRRSFSPPEIQDESVAALQERACRKAFELFHEQLEHCLPLLERLHDLRESDYAKEQVPLLGAASASMERLVATINFAYSSATSMAYAGTLTETLGTPLRGRQNKTESANG